MKINSSGYICKKAFFIVGPTASGKTSLAKELASRLNLELLNFDVAQMYTGLAVGTAKPTIDQDPNRGELFDLLNEAKDFDAVAYRKKATEKIKSSKKVPAFVGGCFFYLKNLFFVRSLKKNAQNLLADIQELNYEHISNLSMPKQYELLQKLDKQRSLELNPNDKYRVETALKLIIKTGFRASDFKEEFAPIAKEMIILVILPSKEELKAKILTRLEECLPSWIEEVELIAKSPWADFSVKKGFIGYKELLNFVKNKDIELEKIKQEIYHKTWLYAKRQICFWKGLKKKLIEKNLDETVKILEVNSKEEALELNFEELSLKEQTS